MATEYALAVDWKDGQDPEILPAKSFEHARRMVAFYVGVADCTVVGRVPGPWLPVTLTMTRPAGEAS